MSVSHRSFTPLALALAALGCAKKVQPKPPPPPPQPVVVTKQITLDEAGLSAAAMDRTVDPCEDFYEFACGNWLKSTPIPPDRSVWNRSFSEIDKQNEEALKEILDRAIESKDGPDEVRKKLGQFYGSCMDEAAIEKAGIKPLEKQLAAIKVIKDVKTLQAALVELHKVGVQLPFHAGAEQDFDDPTRYILALSQGGLGLPNRDYYLSDDPKKKQTRDAYLAHLERTLALLGQKAPQAKQGAKDILALETELAKVSKTPVEMRDPKGLNNKINRDGVIKAAPDFPWDAFFKAMGQPELKDVNVTGVAFFEGMNKLIKGQKPPVWQAYLNYHLASSFSSALPKAFVDEMFKLQQALTGQEQLPERWKRCVDATDRSLGELLAQPYVDRKFGPESKQATEQMVAEISTAFGNGLAKLDWMDDTTREKARAKLKSFANHIGYPSKWKSYDWAADGAYATNVLRSREFELKRDLAHIGQPVDRDEWFMTPPTVNAYYNPQKNEMVFPAGILQPPFYSPKATVAVNMGAMGMVVGHELTHGFDDEGSQFSDVGKLETWWEAATREKFDARTQCLADQYAAYEPLPGVKLNGKLTLGENIADNGGVKLAFDAYRAMRRDSKEIYVADGFSEDQQFFLAVGQAWCTNAKEEVQRMRVTVDPHSPPRFRVNGSLANQPSFGDAFQCKPGSKMRPQNACTVW